MSKVTKTLVIIVVAVAVAGGAGLFLATRSSAPTNSEAAVVPTGGGHVLGPENAPVTLMEFGDYQCPSCGAYFPIVNEVMKRYPTQVRLEFHHYPLVNLHPSAMAAALAAEADRHDRHEAAEDQTSSQLVEKQLRRAPVLHQD